jgi:hypothetical protein
MAPRSADEARLEGIVASGLRSWLAKARDAVMSQWHKHKAMPDPHAIFSTQAAWKDEVDTILTEIGKIGMGAWSRATDVPPVSRHAFVMASLAQTENYLVAIPDEVYNKIFAEITDGSNAGETIDKIAARVDDVLNWSGSQNWPNRARVIATTETTRAYGSATVAAGMEQSRVTGRLLRKKWVSRSDAKVRAAHAEANGQIRALGEPFQVGAVPMQYPGDASAPAGEVVDCRCGVEILNEGNVQ